MSSFNVFYYFLKESYSNTKGGVSKSSQFRAAMKSSVGFSKWEETVFIQVMNTLNIHCFTVRHIFEFLEYLESSETFTSLHEFRNKISKMTSLAYSI